MLGRPSWWILGLAGFLVRGGILVFGLAIISLPSPLALSNVFGPIVTPLYLGRVEPATVALIASAAAAFVAWLVCGSWIAAATEVVLVRDARHAAIEEGLPAGPDRSAGRLLISRAAVAHLLALIPLVVVLGLGSVQVAAVAYRELVNPSSAGPIVLRVISGALGPVVLIVIAWLLGELVGGMAVRRIVLRGESVVGAVGRSAADLVRRPLGGLIAPLATLADPGRRPGRRAGGRRDRLDRCPDPPEPAARRAPGDGPRRRDPRRRVVPCPARDRPDRRLAKRRR